MTQVRQQSSMDVIYEREHFVQFYESDDLFLDNLKNFIGAGLKTGHPCVIIATAKHRQAAERLFEEEGIDIEAARNSGIYQSYDAAETLEKFIVEGLPNKKLFSAMAESVFGDIRTEKQPIRVFGEMVALLWEQGNQGGAILLEEYWNEISREYCFTLFCAYPMYHFGTKAHEEMHRHISALHSSTILP